MPANEAPAHGFSGGHLLLKVVQKVTKTLREFSLLYACDLMATDKEGVKLTLKVLLALVLVTGESAKPDTISANSKSTSARRSMSPAPNGLAYRKNALEGVRHISRIGRSHAPR